MNELYIEQLADDSVLTTLTYCSKKQNKTSRFPAAYYDTYVSRIINSNLNIQRYIFEAIENPDKELKNKYWHRVLSECTYLNHLIRIAYQKKWISSKQRDIWQEKIIKIKLEIDKNYL